MVRFQLQNRLPHVGGCIATEIYETASSGSGVNRSARFHCQQFSLCLVGLRVKTSLLWMRVTIGLRATINIQDL